MSVPPLLLSLPELLQEPDVIIEKRSHIGNIVFEHCYPFDTHPKGKPPVFFIIVFHCFKNIRMYHTCPEYFQPSGLLANPASFPHTVRALHVHFRGRFRKREKTRPEPCFKLFSEHFLRKKVQHSFKVAESYICIDHKPFHLVENRRMRSVRGVPPVDPAGRDYFKGRPVLFHRPYLYGRCVSPEQVLFLHIKSIVHIHGRMIHWKIKGGEIIVLAFYFRAC